jgi:prepilin-type N-terminal cleavage/methylation domain-containing protein
MSRKITGSGEVVQTELNESRVSAGTHSEADRVALRSCAEARGFSLIELLVVVAVILVVAAFAVPNMVSTLDAFRLRSSMNSAMSMTQRARLAAIKQNQTQELQFIVNGNQVVLYYKNANSANLGLKTTSTAGNPADAQFWMPTPFSIPGVPAGPTALTGLIMWNSNVNPNSVNVPMFFNSRGMPGDATGYLYYFTYKSANRTRWAAVSVSPAGRIQSWFWNGNGWGN